jgi:hypothetical protein
VGTAEELTQSTDLNTLCVNIALRFKCPTRAVHCIKILSPYKNIYKK